MSQNRPNNVIVEENHPTLSSGPDKKCPGQAIYSELNYEKLRNDRISEVDNYYRDVLKKYEENKKKYNTQFKDTAAEANTTQAELEQKTGDGASPDEIQEGTETLKPLVVKLNNQLLEIARQVMEDNEKTGKGVYQQYQDLKTQEAELDKLMNNVSKLENNLDTESNVQLTRNSRMDTSYERGRGTYSWYVVLVYLNIVVLLFLIVYMITLSGYMDQFRF